MFILEPSPLTSERGHVYSRQASKAFSFFTEFESGTHCRLSSSHDLSSGRSTPARAETETGIPPLPCPSAPPSHPSLDHFYVRDLRFHVRSKPQADMLPRRLRVSVHPELGSGCVPCALADITCSPRDRNPVMALSKFYYSPPSTLSLMSISVNSICSPLSIVSKPVPT
jgi:hypothetical protein